MAFRNPITSLPASAITGEINGDQIAPGTITGTQLAPTAADGMTITGAILQTADSGNRVVIEEGTRNGQTVGQMVAYTEVATDSPGLVSAYGPADGTMRGLLLSPPAADTFVGDVPTAWLSFDPEAGTSRIDLTADDVWVEGELHGSGGLTVLATDFTTYTPTVTGGGSATFSTAEGWYYRFGSLVYVEAYLVASAAGSGLSNVAISLPVMPYRGSANRQVITAYCGAVSAGTNSSTSGPFCCLTLAGGTLAQVDQLQGPTDKPMRGENISATTVITMDGWYRST